MTNREKYPEAFAIFEKYAMRYDQNPEEKRYGIAHPDKSGKFIYSNDIATLFQLFKGPFYLNTSVGAKARAHLDWLERLEGKQSR